MRQSVPYLEDNILEYISSAKNQLVKDERVAAYTSLLASLKEFFAIDFPLITRENGKKPSITSHKVFFNISHCDGVSVVSLSDTDDMGVDIQTDPDEKTMERLKKRFISNVRYNPGDIDITFYLLEKSDNELMFSEICGETIPTDFSDKWSAMESVMKLYGSGFSALPDIDDLCAKSTTNVINIKIADKYYSIANSIKNG
jgi:phosphopantetheinyl transferase